jgi:DNA-binding transcriptional ArsR family regulator
MARPPTLPFVARARARTKQRGRTVEETAEALRVLGNPLRLQILGWLADPDTHFADMEPIANRHEFGVCVSHIQAKAELAQSTVSAYMAEMQRAGLVTATRVGKWTHYRRDEEAIAELLRSVADAVESHF